ncbi:MAG: DEAD/DEAH box helicase family protein [bacterium]
MARISKVGQKGRGTKNAVQTKFAYKLALNQWMLRLFDVERFEDIALHLREENLEGLDGDNIHYFYHALVLHFPDLSNLTPNILLEYDQNIVRHTQILNARRISHGEQEITWKYFQYLALLFTEIYLDKYFEDATALRSSITTQINAINIGKDEADQIKPFDDSTDPKMDLNKLAYWIATGGGKTLIMHANILQYRYYLEKYGRKGELNRVILLTPNDGLSQQHLREFKIAGISAEIFSKGGGELFTSHAVEIIDINKLREDSGDTTVAVNNFEGKNLVLIDEGHRGASSGEEGAWMRFRNALCEKGFSFEYSATFSQAVRGNATLTGIYSRCILFDYSYRYFYNDGFGKDYQILNLDEEIQGHHLELYMTACLLAFFQQQKLFKDHEASFRAFHIDKPLWIFVGSKVTANLATKDASDIVEILKFLARFVSDRRGSIEHIGQILYKGLITAAGKNLFANKFNLFNTFGLQPEAIYAEILDTLFNAAGGGLLYVENLKGAIGEIALRIGADNEPFGVINVGDDAKLVKLCEDHGIETGDRDFTGSLFHDINKKSSTVNILIGSKKFTEGWSSWRVSTMGLMNVGATEGAQIIQLFGRGVRLKGYNQSLKRSNRITLPNDVKRPEDIGILETLSIFGIHADYMAQFRDFLEEEGLPNEEEREEFFLPVIRDLGSKPLKTIRLKKIINGVNTDFGDAFRRLGPIPTLDLPKDYLQKNQVIVNWYPKIQALRSKGMTDDEKDATTNVTHLQDKHIAFLDLEYLYFEIERFKAGRGWFNFNINKQIIERLLLDQSWYQLYIPQSELDFKSFNKVQQWQQIALALLIKYTKLYYSYCKKDWELPHLEYTDVKENDPNLLCREDAGKNGYRILINESQVDIANKLRELKANIESGNLKPWEFSGIKALWFGKHLYQPLLCLEKGIVEISPAPLNKGEMQFVEDLKEFYDNSKDFFEGKELYLLRNLSKGRGVGFFEAGNFHPDFILWILYGDKQFVTFVDPKGIHNLGATDPKIEFYKEIKKIELRLGDTNVTLNSFIISNTPSHAVKRQWNISKQDMTDRNILFEEEDKSTYIKAMLTKIMQG